MEKPDGSGGPVGEEFLTVGDVAREAGVSVQAVREWSARGRLPVTRAANGWRLYSRSSVQKFLAARQAAIELNKVR